MTAASMRLGLVAGSGELPLLIAQSARRAGLQVSAIGLAGEACPTLAEAVDSWAWLGAGQLGGMIRHLRQAGVRRACLAGGLRKTRLFAARRLDWAGLAVLAGCLVRHDDGLLRAVAARFLAGGIRIVDASLYLPWMLAPRRVMTRRAPSRRQRQDLALGLQLARDIGRLGVGQTVVVRDGAVVAMEAIEGTDACLRRAGQLAGGGHATAVKVAKPGQDLRFDLPTVGRRTLRSLADAGIGTLGVEASRTLILHPTKFAAEADRLGLCVVGL